MGAAAPLPRRVFLGKRLQERFFDYHEDLSPQQAADILGGRVVDYLNRNNEWVGLVGNRESGERSNESTAFSLIVIPTEGERVLPAGVEGALSQELCRL